MYELNVVEETVTLGGGERRLARTKVIRISKDRDEERHLAETRGKAKATDKCERFDSFKEIGRREKEIRGDATRNRYKHRRHDARGRLGCSRGGYTVTTIRR